MAFFKETAIVVGREWNTRSNWATGSSFVFITLYAFCVFTEYNEWLLPLALAYWTSDYLDGHWARKLTKHTVLGKILDPVRDHYCDLLLSFSIAWTISSGITWFVMANIWFVEFVIIIINCREWAKEQTCGGFVHLAGKIGRQMVYIGVMILFSLYSYPLYLLFLPSWGIFSSEALLLVMYFASVCALCVYGKARKKFS